MIADVVIIGAGIVGACCARACAQSGLDTVLVDRGAVASGTTGAGEGNVLVSDKEPGPELDLALLSRQLWAEMAGELGDSFELDPRVVSLLRRAPRRWITFTLSRVPRSRAVSSRRTSLPPISAIMSRISPLIWPEASTTPRTCRCSRCSRRPESSRRVSRRVTSAS